MIGLLYGFNLKFPISIRTLPYAKSYPWDGGHIGVPKQWNDSHVGAQIYSPEIELNFYATFFVVSLRKHGCWSCEWKPSLDRASILQGSHIACDFSTKESYYT